MWLYQIFTTVVFNINKSTDLIRCCSSQFSNRKRNSWCMKKLINRNTQSDGLLIHHHLCLIYLFGANENANKAHRIWTWTAKWYSQRSKECNNGRCSRIFELTRSAKVFLMLVPNSTDFMAFQAMSALPANFFDQPPTLKTARFIAFLHYFNWTVWHAIST